MQNLIILMAVLAGAAVLTEGEERLPYRTAIFGAFAVAGWAWIVFFTEFIETWRGYVAITVGWLVWWAKMIADPMDTTYRATTYRANGYPDPFGITTLIFMSSMTGIILSLF